MLHNKVMLQQVPQIENSFNKILTVIKSCVNKEQLKGASNMIKNFKTLYNLVGYPKILSYKLENELQNKYIVLRCQL